MSGREPLLLPDAEPGLVYLTEGSFGSIFHKLGDTVCYKTVREEGHGQKLRDEYNLYREGASVSTLCKRAGEFMIPQATEFHDPSSPRPNVASPLLVPHDTTVIAKSFIYPTISLTLIPPVSPRISTTYKRLFWSPSLQADDPSDIRLFRLYFGKTDNPGPRTQLHPGLRSDPPLEITQYIAFSNELAGRGITMPSVEDVVVGMAEVLVRMHWVMGVNARDIELVLGGDGAEGVGFYCMDFNQCQRWIIPDALQSLRRTPKDKVSTVDYPSDDLAEGMRRLAKLIYYQEVYYPRPSQGGMYELFKSGYMRALEVLLDGPAGKGRVSDDDDKDEDEKGAEEEEGWLAKQRDIVAAAKAFFLQFEKEDKDRSERSSRMRKSEGRLN